MCYTHLVVCIKLSCPSFCTSTTMRWECYCCYVRVGKNAFQLWLKSAKRNGRPALSQTSLRNGTQMANVAKQVQQKQMGNSNNREIMNSKNNNSTHKKEGKKERNIFTGERQTEWTKLTRLLRYKISPLAIYLCAECVL